MAQFQSYSGGPHGMGAMQLPEKPGILGEIGQAMGAIGQIPQQMQAAQLKNALTSLLIKSLTLPQTEETTVPGEITGFQPGSEPEVLENGFSFYDNPAPINQSSYGDIFTRTPDKKVQGPNPEYTQTLNRLKEVGPAFGFDFNKGSRSTEDLLALELARQSGRKELEGVRAENKSIFETQRQGNREKLLADNTASREKIANQYNKTRETIAKDNRTSIEDRANKLLIESSKHHRAIEANYAERTKAIRSTTNNLDEIRVLQQIDRLTDNLRATRTQLDKIRQLDASDKEVAAEQKTAMEEYNHIVDQIKRLDSNAPYSKLGDTETKSDALNWLRSFGLPGFNQPEKAITTKPSGNPAPMVQNPSNKEETPEQRRNRLLNRK